MRQLPCLIKSAVRLYLALMVLNETSGIWKSGAFKVRSFRKGLPADYSLEQLQTAAVAGRLKDTFEGHLRRAGKVLIQDSHKAVLLDLKSGRLEEQEADAGWKFADELKGGPVGFQCMELSRLRAFTGTEDVEVLACSWAVKDALDKTVVRFDSMQLGYGSKQAVWICIRPLRGYDAAAQHALQAFKSCGFSAGGFDYLNALGISRPMYEPKPGAEILPDSPVAESAGRIVETFLAVARRNEPGLAADIDTEFLHDYRVSLRRVRSLLSLFKGVYADDFCRSVKMQLADMMKQTNRLRDLDVYLLDRGTYYDMVPESLFAGLDIMFKIFREEREEELRKIRLILEQAEYDARMNRLLADFQPVEKINYGPAALADTGAFAKRQIFKRYRKAASIASGIEPSTPESAVHELRIQCKKLRYLMEFFLPLFPARRIKPLIKSLKELQDMLGRFNDYCVQRESLAAFVEQHPIQGRKGLQAAESAGALVAALFQLQQKARREVETNLKHLVNRETAAAYRSLFAEE